MAKQIAAPPAPSGRRLTMDYREFLSWTNEDIHAEWVDGEVTVFMPPSVLHQRVVGFLYVLMSWYARRFDLGEVLVAPLEMLILDGRSSREPDVLFVARTHADRITGMRIDGPADLVVEVVSDESVIRDRREKLADYQNAGIPEYWLLDPRPGQRRASFFRLGDDGGYVAMPPDESGRYHSATLPGFWIDPAWLWLEPLPDPDDLKILISPGGEVGRSCPACRRFDREERGSSGRPEPVLPGQAQPVGAQALPVISRRQRRATVSSK